MSRPTQEEYVPQWYGCLSTLVTDGVNQGIGGPCELEPEGYYREVQFNAFIPNTTATTVATIQLGPTSPLRAERYLVEMTSTITTFSPTPGNVTRYQICRVGVPITGGATTTQFGRITQSSSGADILPTYVTYALIPNQIATFVVEVYTETDCYMSGTIVISGNR